jgi:hypothetical protein
MQRAHFVSDVAPMSTGKRQPGGHADGGHADRGQADDGVQGDTRCTMRASRTPGEKNEPRAMGCSGRSVPTTRTPASDKRLAPYSGYWAHKGPGIREVTTDPLPTCLWVGGRLRPRAASVAERAPPHSTSAHAAVPHTHTNTQSLSQREDWVGGSVGCGPVRRYCIDVQVVCGSDLPLR